MKKIKIEEDKLFFYSKSKDLPAGKGVNEVVNDPSEYEELNSIKNWRHVLSNFHEETFEFEGRLFKSIEHAFQAYKLAIVDPNMLDLFAYNDSKNEDEHIGNQSSLNARKNRKLIKLNQDQLKTWDSKKEKFLLDVSTAKFKSSTDSRKVLLATKNAQLFHIESRKKIHTRFIHLEILRLSLKSKS
jgi:predicted NAD-dependent protein-ADP-ribosyltransferase YbiA (DUF1768 family)